jgi:hypothetical protein
MVPGLGPTAIVVLLLGVGWSHTGDTTPSARHAPEPIPKLTTG